jgi:hypothetical protein
MNSRMEYGARAALCRELAVREPAHGAIWLAEAERWLQLARTGPSSPGSHAMQVPVTALCGNLLLPGQLSSIADSQDRASEALKR